MELFLLFKIRYLGKIKVVYINMKGVVFNTRLWTVADGMASKENTFMDNWLNKDIKNFLQELKLTIGIRLIIMTLLYKLVSSL